MINILIGYVNIFNKLTAESFAARLKQANLVSKTDFDNKLTSSNITKYLEAQKKLDSLTTNDYIFFLGRMCFTSNDELKTPLFINQHLIC